MWVKGLKAMDVAVAIEWVDLGLRISALIHGCSLTEIREFKFDLFRILSLDFFFF